MQDYKNYDRYIVFFSGGKDSLASLLYLLLIGVPKEKIEIWHHLVDGKSEGFMDWPHAAGYCRAVAKHFGIPIYFSWKKGGFKRELERSNEKSLPTYFETPATLIVAGGNRGKGLTRGLFPALGDINRGRWCSAILKICVAKTAIVNQERFNNSRTLVISGERAEESTARAKYQELEPHESDCRNSPNLRRHVDRWRPIHKWSEQQVWSIIQLYKINPSPAYRAGFGRLSCAFCIFGNKNQFASARKAMPERFEAIANKERKSGQTIKPPNSKGTKTSISAIADAGTPYPGLTSKIIKELTDPDWDLQIFTIVLQLINGNCR